MRNSDGIEMVECDECGDSVPANQTYERRGRIWCERHDFDEQAEKREQERQEVMEITTRAVASQVNGQWWNDRSLRPVIKVKEPAILRAYERKEGSDE